MAVKTAARGVRCQFECKDKDGNPRYCPPDSEYTICAVCRSNMGGWVGKLREAEAYFDRLGVRTRRLNEVCHPTGKGYVAHIIAVRKRRKH
jgi:hypothetical protein